MVSLDRGTYGCSHTVGIEMRDGDLGGAGTHDVLATATSGDSETVTLTETETDSAVFVGSIPTGAGPVTTEDGTLQVADGPDDHRDLHRRR